MSNISETEISDAKTNIEQQTEILEKLLEQSIAIEKRLAFLNDHKLIQVYNSIPHLLWFQLLKGIALGLGSVLGASVVLSGLVYLLSQIEFLPIIGEWVTAILELVKQPT